MNDVFQGDGFYISYNPNTDEGPETALVKKNPGFLNNEFYILKGDWFDDFIKLVPAGFDVCKKFYDLNSDNKSVWSKDGALSRPQ